MQLSADPLLVGICGATLEFLHAQRWRRGSGGGARRSRGHTLAAGPRFG